MRDLGSSYMNALGEKVDTQGSFFMQPKYINGENKSIAMSKGDFEKNVAPQSIDIGKKPPLMRGQSDRRFNKGGGGQSLLKTALKNNMNAESPMNGPVAIPDSFESIASAEVDSEGSVEDNKSEGMKVPPKLKNKASSFRNPKAKLE